MNNNNKKTNYRTGKRFTAAERKKITTDGMKYCSKCMQLKPTSAFSINRSRPDGLQYVCRECTNKKERKRYEKRKVKDYKKDKAENKNYLKYIESFKNTKKAEIEKGLICAECGVYFQCSHGRKVICLSCYHHLKIRNPQRLPEYKLAWLPEIEPVNMYDDRREVARINGINRIKMYEQS